MDVKFSTKSEKKDSCASCDNTFKSENKLNTTFIQMNDTTSYVSGKSGDMIADLGCPNTVLGRKDVKNFVDNLSEELRESVEVIKADENFRFGPSGPFKCTEKLRLKLDLDQETIFIDIAIVDADIPMLLGNNLLKPLEAQINLFKGGNGNIKLGDVKLDMKETRGGHYTVKVQDLGKLCKIATATFFLSSCDKCGKTFENVEVLGNHKQDVHSNNQTESILKNSAENANDLKQENNCIHKIIEDLNTQLNGKLSKMDQNIFQIMKRMAKIQQVDSNINCDICAKEKCSKTELRNHTGCKHGNETTILCDLCEKEKRNRKCLKRHKTCNHGIEKSIVCELCEKEKHNEDCLKEHIDWEHRNQKTCECDLCKIESIKKKIVKEHHAPENRLDQIFLSHHEEEDGDEEELESEMWNILLTEEEDENADNGLTEDEEKEILKIHKYFAHRSAQKLWENLFKPAGKMKGKKKLIMEFLDKCQVCKR